MNHGSARLGSGEGQLDRLSPTPTSPHPACLPLTTPGFAYAQANNRLEELHSPGAGEAKRLLGHADSAQI